MEINYYKSIVLGIIQGLTEFLPISSSGHIVIAKELFFINSIGIFYEVFMHFGTSISIIVVFRKEITDIVFSFFTGIKYLLAKRSLNSELIKDRNFKLGIYIILATIPAGIAGVLFEGILLKLFENSFFVSIALIFTGIFLFSTRYIKEGNSNVKLFNSLLIGCAQALAIIPGISRSGMTVGLGLFLKIKREKAVRFSFFLSLPVILGATVLKLFEISNYNLNLEELIQIFIASLSAFFTGYIAIKLLLKVVIAGKFHIFSYYCILIGILGIVFFV